MLVVGRIAAFLRTASGFSPWRIGGKGNFETITLRRITLSEGRIGAFLGRPKLVHFIRLFLFYCQRIRDDVLSTLL